jgi:NCS1 family nucleobase:cation symporter-1
MASNDFIDFFTNFLFLFAHGIAPWSAIILLHWYLVGKREPKTPTGITVGCVIFVVVTAASIWLFSANSLYTGLLTEWVGGVDVGPYVGFIVAGLAYIASIKLWPLSFNSGPPSNEVAH